MRQSQEQKAVENLVDSFFQKHGSNVQFNIFDLSKITKAGIEAARAGGSIEQAVIDAIAKYRQN